MTTRCKKCSKRGHFRKQRGMALSRMPCSCGGQRETINSRQVPGPHPLFPEETMVHPDYPWLNEKAGKQYHEEWKSVSGEFIYDKRTETFIPWLPISRKIIEAEL